MNGAGPVGITGWYLRETAVGQDRAYTFMMFLFPEQSPETKNLKNAPNPQRFGPRPQDAGALSDVCSWNCNKWSLVGPH